MPDTTLSTSGGLSRRRLFAAGGAAAVGVAGTAVAGGLVGRATASEHPTPATESLLVPFHGEHQAGVATRPQTHAVVAAYTLRGGATLEAAGRMMRLVTDDARRLTAATPALNDQEPALAQIPARLTVTVGFGSGLFSKLGLTDEQPAGLIDLPAFRIDRLQPAWSGGDLILQVCADDPLVVAHALRQLTKTLRTFTTGRWVQRGFTQTTAQLDGAGAGRNLMGQVDGTANPGPDTPDFAPLVWAGGPGWFSGGTTMVVRRIAMQLDTWDELDTAGKEIAVGRRLHNGAPLTGSLETDEPDFTVTDTTGLPVIPAFAHIARARHTNDTERFLRRAYNYDDGLTDSGLIFTTFQADIARQYLPVQQRLADNDLMNEWTTPIGSATFALPPGCSPDGYLGEGLLP
ncbi:Dyp-type peroxidase [Microlunatus aurantiacus]|uniref:Dyp-type peroxidase n=1 Tax=Microlunatus aurantiacus TaxID=446786 RepID=A0ABP7DL94_9ACTN